MKKTIELSDLTDTFQAVAEGRNGHEYVDLGLSVKWATMNLGAERSRRLLRVGGDREERQLHLGGLSAWKLRGRPDKIQFCGWRPQSGSGGRCSRCELGRSLAHSHKRGMGGAVRQTELQMGVDKARKHAGIQDRQKGGFYGQKHFPPGGRVFPRLFDRRCGIVRLLLVGNLQSALRRPRDLPLLYSNLHRDRQQWVPQRRIYDPSGHEIEPAALL